LDILSVNDKLRICFDTNHLLKEDAIAFLKRVGEKIVTLHVSDYDYVDECHWLPGEGTTDWGRLYDALCRVGYEGAWLYELGFAAPPSIERERALTCEDFAKNAREIFRGLPLTVLGTPKI
jgi:sugar phosphate isomerase/epimerase